MTFNTKLVVASIFSFGGFFLSATFYPLLGLPPLWLLFGIFAIFVLYFTSQK